MNNKLPAFMFYPGDWRKDPGVQSLGFHDRGVWFEMLCLMHESEDRGKLTLNGQPMPESALARLLGLDNQILTTTLTTLLTYGVASRCEDTGAICCRRMIRDEKLRQIRKECGKKGGNPLLVNQKPTTKDNQKTTPSYSDSLSFSENDLCGSSLKSEELPSYPPIVETLWKLAIPKAKERSSKKKVSEAWQKLKPKPNEELVKQSFESWSKCHDWTKDGGQFAPGVHLWIKDRKWENENPSQKLAESSFYIRPPFDEPTYQKNGTSQYRPPFD